MITLDEAGHELLHEIRERLVHIEQKIDVLPMSSHLEANIGHPDQVFGGITYAQHGDDLIAMCLLHSIGISKPTYLDVGAHHPLNISNTALLYKYGGHGINVEPNPNLFVNFPRMRPGDINLNVGVAAKNGKLTFYMIDDYSGRNTFDFDAATQFIKTHPEFSIGKTMEIEVLTINDIVNRYSNGVFPDFLSLDVEGLDEEIIISADFTHSKPKVICVEISNSSGEKSRDKISETLDNKGYYRVIRAVGNLFFVDENYTDCIR